MKRTSSSKKPAARKAVETDSRFMPVLQAFTRDKRVSRGGMFGSTSLRVNGKVFAMMHKGKFVAKLSKERVDELVAAGTGEQFDPGHGRLMKEWVALAGAEDLWVGLAKEAYRFVAKGK